ncbi:phage tail protein [Alkalimonas amylolytica]|uniref:Microcystin-dependent protein n=1 Tax=Alkalimonas amylolytica TaxID=152573 RepID=A0A1H4CS39_ALKAM|nr:tail fiber protein [Alkalimonas amylolytica]SEA63128.1 Microcystin-dependent protein [Alkalimonas amylolytica]
MADPFLGEIRMFAGTYAPQGWAFCAGQELPISSNSALYSILGTTYGGNGTTSFRLPNLQGRVPLCAGQSPGSSHYQAGQTGGQEQQTLTQAQMPPHTHTIDLDASASLTLAQQASSEAANASTPGETVVPAKIMSGFNATNAYSSSPNTTLKPMTGNATVELKGSSGSAGGGAPVSLMQPYTAVSFIIALQGIYPSRG